jgi:dipeptidyl-peptidase-3
MERVAGDLTTNMHEVIGHASGKVEERLNGNPAPLLKEQFSALEEARADLVALYFLPIRNWPRSASWRRPISKRSCAPMRPTAETRSFSCAGSRGTQIEEDHMRNRQMIVRWLMPTPRRSRRTRDGRRAMP